ncbi:hypothetical protein DO97_17030 [Neosynechococcus sphagnicola sy1]|uniref:RNA-binding protein containing a PIN domain protein n=1 Tax=Neosynechococcus sphagnicola sy1 TaxID=1497020 RepID=A0A098TLC0_9CYAN|nr:NYN domain-containing protein [Neosynechococcus sphagnicola]KGF71638.1 hypothetical protein DO97_17030 [Neosynechococcus sphagnicola sy1]
MVSRSLTQATLLVDGYNIVGAWSSLIKLRDLQGLSEARRVLTEDLINYSAARGYETQLVFDAHYQAGGGSREVWTPNLSVYYTDFGQSADTYIEKACALFRHNIQKFQRRLIVATSDRAQQLTVVGYGAEWMSAQQLQQDLDAATQRVRQQQRSSQRSSQRFLASSLDPIAQERLARLRLGLRPD